MSTELITGLMQTTLVSSAAVALVLVLRRPMRAAFGSGAAYGLWALVPVALIAVLLPAPASPVVLIPMAASIGGMQPVDVPMAASSVPWALLLMAGWAVGVVAMGGLQLWQQRRFLQRLGPLRVHAHRLSVAASNEGLPAVTGVLRPRIVLPADFLTRYDAVERALIVAHERQHIARGDLPCNALVALLRCVYWFNPLLHWAVARYRHDQELACDARVLARHPRARRSYALAMLKTQLDAFALPVGCHWHAHPIKERIAMLKRPSPGRWQTGLSSALLLALFAGVGYAAWAQQPAPARVAQLPSKAALAPQAHKATERPSVGSSEPAAFDPSQHQPPRYPKDAANAGITGRVVMLVDVAADGSVKGVVIDHAEPAGVFEAVSLEAARQWKFLPMLEHGKPVAHRVRVPIDFDIDPPAAPKQEADAGQQGMVGQASTRGPGGQPADGHKVAGMRGTVPAPFDDVARR